MCLLYLGLLLVMIPVVACAAVAPVATCVVLMCGCWGFIIAMIAYEQGLHTPSVREELRTRLARARSDEHFAHDIAFLSHELGDNAAEERELALEAHAQAEAADLERALDPAPVQLTDEQMKEW